MPGRSRVRQQFFLFPAYRLERFPYSDGTTEGENFTDAHIFENKHLWHRICSNTLTDVWGRTTPDSSITFEIENMQNYIIQSIAREYIYPSIGGAYVHK